MKTSLPHCGATFRIGFSRSMRCSAYCCEGSSFFANSIFKHFYENFLNRSYSLSSFNGLCTAFWVSSKKLWSYQTTWNRKSMQSKFSFEVLNYLKRRILDLVWELQIWVFIWLHYSSMKDRRSDWRSCEFSSLLIKRASVGICCSAKI